MKPCKSLNAFFDPSFRVGVEVQLQRVADAGFRHLDMNFWDWSHDPASPFMQDGWRDWVSRIAEAAARAGAVFTQAHAHVHNFYDKTDIAVHERQIERSVIGAGMLGVPWIVLHPSQIPDRSAPGSHARMAEENAAWLRRYAGIAGECGTGIAVENMSKPAEGPVSAEELIELIDLVGLPNVGACWDTGHANIAGLDQPASIRKLGGRLHALHVADNRGTADEHTMPFIGSIDWPPILSALRDIGYGGDFTFEAHNFVRRMPEGLKADALRLMYRVGAVLSGCGEP